MWSYSKGMVKASLSVLALTSDGYVRMSAEICDAFLDPTKGFDHVKNASIPWPPIPMIFFWAQRSGFAGIKGILVDPKHNWIFGLNFWLCLIVYTAYILIYRLIVYVLPA